MMKLRFFLALWASKFTIWFMHLCRRNASHLPGEIALKICPDYLKMIAKTPCVICVTGTDGKTTTSNLIADLLRSSGKSVICNSNGSNTQTGISAALTASVSLGNKTKAQYSVLETDEHWTRIVCSKLRPDFLVVTNLLRDSLQRNAHSEYVAWKIGLLDSPETKLILNADELCSAALLPQNPRVYFGIDRLPGDGTESENRVNDFRLCPNCGKALVFDYVRYAHIGRCHCSSCDFVSHDADYRVTAIDAASGKLSVKLKDRDAELPLTNDTIFNVYNELTAIAVLSEAGFSPEELREALANTPLTKKRYEEFTVGSVRIVNMMAKSNNSLPVSLVLDHIRRYPGSKAVILALDDLDEKRSSERIGWIYDTDYEFLNDSDVLQIIAVGKRFADHRLRLLLAGIPEEKLFCCEDESEGIRHLGSSAETVFLLHDMSSYPRSVKAVGEIRAQLEGNA